MSAVAPSSARAVWVLVTGVLAVMTAGALAWPSRDAASERPGVLFAMVTVSALACIVAATLVIAVADRREIAEIGLLGTALMATAVMPLAHGLVTPGVLYGDTPAFRAAAFLTMPVAVISASPLLVPRSRFGRWAARHWRDWALLALLGVFLSAALVVAFPDVLVVPGPADPLTIAAGAAGAAALVALSLRQLRFHELGGRRSNLTASLSLVVLAASALLPTVRPAYGLAFWWLHLAGVIGALGVSIGLLGAKHPSRSMHAILAPVLARDPLVAFELGLSPVVHRFVSDLDAKDQPTRDHVVRTAEMAIRIGERLGLSAPELRRLGLAALLHDVGKLDVPVSILTKPGPLTVDEYETIKRHTVDGEAMLLAEPALAVAAPIVRSHHERIDGGGYPDGLAGDAIPIGARIIAVCDAFDAMTHEHRYRRAMPSRLALAVLRDLSGSQWDPVVVRELVGVLPSMPAVGTLDAVGRPAWPVDRGPATVPDDLVVDVDALLAAVDAQI